MYIFLIVFHIIVCLVLISVILLQAGKGGGLTETFGSDGSQSILGTQAPAILKKATTVSAIAFLVTSLVLGMVTARRGRSLLNGMRMPTVAATAKEENVDSAKTGEKTGVEVTPKNEPISDTPIVK